MCTITYYPHPRLTDNFIITDNRDESVQRPALSPDYYQEMGTRLFYPKDIVSGGTWFGLGKMKRLVCLMNGAFKPHKRTGNYRKSRGIVVKEFLSAKDFYYEMKNYDFDGIEPFYAIVFSWANKTEIREIIWDGQVPTFQIVNPELPQIWAAAMTYSPEQYQIKKKQFNDLINEGLQHKDVSDSLWQLHHSKEADEQEGYIINRGMLRTSSIIQVHFSGQNDISYRYHDLIQDTLAEGKIHWPV